MSEDGADTSIACTAPKASSPPFARVGAKGGGRFDRIGWDEALGEIAERFAAIAGSADGPQAILPYSYYGTMGKLQASSLDRRFFHRLGVSMLDRTICASAGSQGTRTRSAGAGSGADRGGARVPLHRQLGVEHGQHEQPPLEPDDPGAQGSGATIVTVDPYRSPTAARSDWHIQPRPGTDAALALALMHVIWRDGLQDEEYLERRPSAPGWSAAGSSTNIPRAASAEITGVEAATSKQFARRFAREQPALIRLNYGLQRHGGGGMAVRTVACLPALVGAWRHPGGGALLSTSGTYDFANARLERPDLSPAGTRTVNMNRLGRGTRGELPGPPVRAL